MKKLFTYVRQGNLEEVKRMITAKPKLLDCVAGPLPKKDHGQSLLQVALKSGNFDIADYLIDKGINVDFIEKEDDDAGLRAPVLFDAISAAIGSLCINQFSKPQEIRIKFERSDRALALLQKILLKGAGTDKRSSNGISALSWSLLEAEKIMRNRDAYPFSQEKVREQLKCIFDLLLEYGADYKTWAEEGLYTAPCPGPSIRSIYFDEERSELGIDYGTVREMRFFLQSYFRNRGL